MIRSAVVLLTLGVVCMAQYRPSYYPRPGGFNTVLTTDSEGAPVNLGDRNSAFQPDAPGSDNYLKETPQVDHIPKDKLPFWYINQQHINQHLNQPVPCSGEGCPQLQATANRGSFAGSAAPARGSFSASATRN